MDDNKFYTETFLENNFLLSNIQGGIVYSDFEAPFHLRYSTEGMAKLTGYTVEELSTMVQMDIVHDDDKAVIAADVSAQFAQGDTFEIEYRLKRKDGTYVYVLDRAKVVTHDDGAKYIHCLLTDISKLKEMGHALKLNQEKYKLAIQQSGNVIIDYNILTKRLSFSPNYLQLFGCSAPAGTLSEIVLSGWVGEDYREKLLSMFSNVIKTATTQSLELLIHTSFDGQVWCSLYLIPILDNGNLYSIVGCLENIDAAKNKIAQLTTLSRTDSLTGVYNRHAMEEVVNSQIEAQGEDELFALMILDIDRFKQINDENGHDYGDAVLIELSKTAEMLLPSTAVFGRLGGDEFLIFAKFNRNAPDLNELSQRVVSGIRDQFKRGKVAITISMGAAWYTEKCNSFKQLYKNADIALYYTKNKGRNGYTIFEE